MKKYFLGIVLALLITSNGWFFFQYHQYKHAVLIPCEIKTLSIDGEDLWLSLVTFQAPDSEQADLTYSLAKAEVSAYQHLLKEGNHIILVMNPDTVVLTSYPGQLHGKLLEIR